MEPSDHMLNEVAGGRLRAADADVGRSRERNRQRRLLTIAVILAVPALWLWFRILTGRAVDLTNLSLPTVDPFLLIVGEKEVEAGTVSVRKQGEGDQGAVSVAAFAEMVKGML